MALDEAKNVEAPVQGASSLGNSNLAPSFVRWDAIAPEIFSAADDVRQLPHGMLGILFSGG